MSLLGRLRYFANVDILGHGVLRVQRLQMQRKLARRKPRPDSLFGPPLQSSAWLKELISRHYLAGRYARDRGPVAWVTSGAPIEFLSALGYFLLYPENHAAVCGIRRWGEKQCLVAEEAGYSRDLCSYARTDFGTLLSGKSPVGRLPKPDLLVCCTNICQTVLHWYQVLAEHFKVPLILIDTPFIYTEASDHALGFVEEQLEEAFSVAEKVAGRKLHEDKLRQVMQDSHEAVSLWMQILDRARAKPAPISAFDEFIHMGPIVEMRGQAFTVAYYRALLAELDRRIEQGVGVLREERIRLLWDNLPIWYQMRPLSQMLAEHGATLVASTYTNAWGELADMIDPSEPIPSMARVYMHPILNRGTGHKLKTMRRMVDDFGAHGVILHSDRSCKPYSIGQMDQRERLVSELGVPALLLEADHNDPRSYSEEQTDNRLMAFLEMLTP